MKEEKNILDPLDNPALKRNPFIMPEGYLTDLENSVHDRIYRSSTPFMSFIFKTKSYVTLGVSFLLILGIGYGVFALTSRVSSSEDASIMSVVTLIENGYLSSSFIDNYYDQIDVDEDLTSDINKDIVIEDKDLFDYLLIYNHE